MKTAKDYSGKKFHNLLIVKNYSKRINGKVRRIAECVCDCGTRKEISTSKIILNKTKSCGCIRKPNQASNRNSEIYPHWKAMRGRILNKNCEKHHRYGGRGIEICDEWSDFKVFKEWALNNGFKPNLSIDRIDNNGNYSPENCRWVDNKAQSRNRSSNIVVAMNGESKCLTDWCASLNLNFPAIRARIKDLKWDPVKALTTPVRKFRVN